MKKQSILVLTLVCIFVLGLLAFSLFNLYQKSSKTTISCGGDWSYNVQCPEGFYCQSLGQGPSAGGICRPSFLLLLKNAFNRSENTAPVVNSPAPLPTDYTGTKSNTTSQTIAIYTTKDGRYSFQYKGDLQVTEENMEYYENIISIRRGEKSVGSIVFYPPKANPVFDNYEKNIKEGKDIFDTVGLEIEHTAIAGQPALLFNKDPEGGQGAVALVKLEGRYIKFIELGNKEDIVFNTVIHSFKQVNQK